VTTSTRKVTPRKSARKAARPVNKEVDGTAVTPPERFDLPEQQDDQHPAYGKRRLYRYQPKGGQPEIVFPHITTVSVNPKFFWRIYPMNEMFQSFEWMIQAEVPRDIQAQVMDLNDREQADFFRGWFSDITAPQGVSPPGES